MSSPDWKCVTAADGVVKVRTRTGESGSISIMLTSNGVSILASVSAADAAFLLSASSDVPVSG